MPLSTSTQDSKKRLMLTCWARLLAVAALLIMPLGMSAAPAVAAPQHPAMTGMPMEHCPDKTPTDPGKSASAECTMACAAALPALDAPVAQPMSVAREPAQALFVQRLHGLHPETATPPPKHS